MKPSFRNKIVAAAILGLLTAGLHAPASAADGKSETQKVRAALTVTTVKPKAEKWPLTLAANGGLAAWQDAVIAAETGGLRITDLFVDVGAVVRRGQKLAQLSQESVSADVDQQQARVAQAKAELSEAKADADRARAVDSRNVMTEQQISQYLIRQDKAQAALDAANAQLKSQQIRLAQTTIVAVDDGIISSRTATLGAVVQTGAELFRLVRQNRIEWRAEIMADQSIRVKSGQKVRVQLTGNEVAEGNVRVVAPTFDPATRKTLIYVDLPASNSARPGMFVRGDILIGAADAITLPQTAVILRDGFSFAFEVGADQKVTQRKVTTGRRVGDRVEIADGLTANVMIVESGGSFLNDGDTVRIEEAAPKSAQKIQ